MNSFRVAGSVCIYFLVCRIQCISIGITHGCSYNPVNQLEIFLRAPEASGSKIDILNHNSFYCCAVRCCKYSHQFAEVCMYSGVCAHFGHLLRGFSSSFCRSVHVSWLSCILRTCFWWFVLYFLPKCACFLAFVHTSDIFSDGSCFISCRSVHVFWCLCILRTCFWWFVSFLLPKCACFLAFVHTSDVFLVVRVFFSAGVCMYSSNCAYFGRQGGLGGTWNGKRRKGRRREEKKREKKKREKKKKGGPRKKVTLNYIRDVRPGGGLEHFRFVVLLCWSLG